MCALVVFLKAPIYIFVESSAPITFLSEISDHTAYYSMICYVMLCVASFYLGLLAFIFQKSEFVENPFLSWWNSIGIYEQYLDSHGTFSLIFYNCTSICCWMV